MPRSDRVSALAAAAALLFTDYAMPMEDSAGFCNDPVVLAVGDDKGQDHVVFSVGPTDGELADVKGEDHVDFSVDTSDEGLCGDNKGDGHVDFCVDPSGAYAVEAELIGGSDGAEVVLGCAEVDTCESDGGDGPVRFRVGLRPDGAVEVNGEKLAACDPALGARITVAWGAGTGTVVVAVVDADGALCTGYYTIDIAPEMVHVAAAEVRALSIVRQ